MAWKDAKRCTARVRSTGEQCKNPAVSGYSVCRMHGANHKNHGGNPRIEDNLAKLNSPEGREAARQRMKGTSHALNHGLYVKKKVFLNAEERAFFKETYNSYRTAYPTLDAVADEAMLQTVCFHHLMIQRALKSISESDTLGARDLFERHSTKMSEALKQLGLRRDVRAGVAGVEKSPQHFIVALLENYQQRQAAGAEGKEIETSSPAVALLPAAGPEALQEGKL